MEIFVTYKRFTVAKDIPKNKFLRKIRSKINVIKHIKTAILKRYFFFLVFAM